MKSILSALVLLFSLNLWAQEFPAAGYRDETENDMKKLAKGLAPIQEKTIEGIQVKLYLSKDAQKAIAKKAFIVEDQAFNQQKLNDFILNIFEASLQYYRSISPGEEIKELHLVIVDKGGDKNTISEVTEHSRVIQLHLVRWHKYLIKKTPHFAEVSSIHEFGHVINYMYSPKETKLHRELSGILLEGLNFIKLYGMDVFSKGYSFYYTDKRDDLSGILDSDYTNMSVARNLSIVLFTNIYNGTYKGPAEAKQLTEQLIISYIKSPVDDAKGLNQAFEQAKLLDSTGKILTLATLQRDTQKVLSTIKP